MIKYNIFCLNVFFKTKFITISPTASSLSQSVCHALGGFLAEPMTSEQNDLVRKIIFDEGSNHTWLGGSDLFQEGHWFWATSGQAIAISGDDTDWAPGQPNNRHGENCLMIWNNDGHWNDADCDIDLPFVCQKTISSTVVG